MTVSEKNLSFEKETLRTLVSTELDAAVGGAQGDGDGVSPAIPTSAIDPHPVGGGVSPAIPASALDRHPV
jgi:hypothetical protein